MKFSVLIPVYNVKKYIDECLQSVLQQTYADFEVIIIDDGSTDSSGEICDKYALEDKRIRVIHKDNQGLISARRIAISQAMGDYCVFVDSDDAVRNNLLSVLNENITESGADIILYSFLYYDGVNVKGRKKNIFENIKFFIGEEKKELYERLLFSPDINAIWTKCIKTRILKSDKTDYTKYYSYNMGEDVLQSLYPLTAAKKVQFIDDELYLYRYNPDSISRSMRVETIEKKNTCHVYSAMRDHLSKWNMNDDEHIKKLDAAQFGYAMYTFAQYYKAVRKSDRKRVVDFDWNSFLYPDFKLNDYCSDYHKWFFECITNKEYNKLDYFFFIQRVYKKIKAIRLFFNNKCSSCIKKRKY